MAILLILVGTLKASAQVPLQNVSNLLYDGNFFYGVADHAFQVIKVDKESQVVLTFGNRGKGPDEFTSDKLSLAMDESKLYILDRRGLRMSIVDKKTFEKIDEVKIKKPAKTILSYKHGVYGFVSDFETQNPLETNEVLHALRPITDLKNPKKTVFNFKDPNPMNPFYDEEQLEALDDVVILFQKGKSRLFIFSDETLLQKALPGIEPTAIGKSIRDKADFINNPVIKLVWKKKIMPQYVLIQSSAMYDRAVYFQVKSYRKGTVILKYDIDNATFKTLGTLTSGHLIAIEEDTLFLEREGMISQKRLSQVRACSTQPVTFYFRSEIFNETLCTSCKESMFEWVDFLNAHNIPINLVLEDDSWFGTSEITTDVINQFQQWGLWGAMRYTDNCDACFEDPLKVDIRTSKGAISYTFPQPLNVLKEHLSCLK